VDGTGSCAPDSTLQGFPPVGKVRAGTRKKEELDVGGIINDEKIRDEAMDIISGESEEGPDETAPLQDAKNGDLPLEAMTKDELIRKIQETAAASDKTYDLYLRSQAEIDNLKKRHQKEKQDVIKFGNETLIKQLLPVADNLEKAIDHSRRESSVDALIEGVGLTLKGLMDALQRAGVETIEALGAPFDPNYHEAVSEVPDDSVESGTVVKELQKGYMLHQRLLRPSMVVVSRKTA
jgi:molecular chaperone GrpE